MKQIVIKKHGGPKVLGIVNSNIPTPNKSEVLIRVAAAGVNFLDIYHRIGISPYIRELPFTPGMEGSGIIILVGEEVMDFAIGDRVAWASVQKSYSEFLVADQGKISIIPPQVSYEDAAAAALQGATAHYLVNSTFQIGPNHVALVHAAAGGTGNLICQMILKKGGSVIATTSSPNKVKVLRDSGFENVILCEKGIELSKQVKEINNGSGVDVVYDGVGLATFNQSLRTLKPKAMMVLFGASSGQVPLFNLQDLNRHGSLFVTRPKLDDYISGKNEFQDRMKDVFHQITLGILKVHIGGQFELAKAGEAQSFLASRKSIGKIILTM
jgi:NADPH:quinone reductase